MIKINQLKFQLKHTTSDIEREILTQLGVSQQEIRNWSIDKKSIDARKKPHVSVVYSVCVDVKNEAAILKRLGKKVKTNQIQVVVKKNYNFIPKGKSVLKERPIIVGSGPAGLFCAYQLALYGYQPILLERGADIDQRAKDVEEFWEHGTLKLNSNVQFGEGGAGTFSDGKLNTGVKDPFGRNRLVLELFVKHGAPEEILYDGKPHIGTDILMNVVKSMRKEIEALGGTVRFNTLVKQLIIEDKKIVGVKLATDEVYPTSVVVLAIGHSARDTFEMLYSEHVPMEAKSFAVGVRVEHSQRIINQSQYGVANDPLLPPTSYKLAANLENGRGVYSFCMCPGGYVVNASSEEKALAVNGMSYSKRDGSHANSAIVVTVGPDDFKGGDTPLAGMAFQRELEQLAYISGNGNIPFQYFEDFCANKESIEDENYLPEMKGNYCAANIRKIFPEFINQTIEEGIHVFGRKIKGFDAPYTILSGVESRTSSPVRIPRDEGFQSEIRGLYPCGEGAGYAGGITSAAIDGIKVSEAIASVFTKF